MRSKLRNVMGALASCIVLAPGCEVPVAPGASSIAMSATVNGLPWHSTEYFSYSTLDQRKSLYVRGRAQGPSTYPNVRVAWITIALAHVTGPGSYALGGSGTGLGSYSETASDYQRVYSTSATAAGTVVLSQFDPATHTIAGAFAFDAEEALPLGTGTRVVITSGSFSGHYQDRE